jgi:hypothetical protein
VRIIVPISGDLTSNFVVTEATQKLRRAGVDEVLIAGVSKHVDSVARDWLPRIHELDAVGAQFNASTIIDVSDGVKLELTSKPKRGGFSLKRLFGR